MSSAADVKSTHALVLKHVQKARELPDMHDATVVFCLESNLAFEAQHILRAVTQAGIKKWLALQEGVGGSLGFLTTNATKEAMCLMLRDALRIGCIALHEQFFSHTQTVSEIKHQLGEELKTYTVIVEPGRTPFCRVRKTYSGKIGGRQDDVCVALQLALIGLRTFTSSDKYSNFRPRHA